MRKPTQGRPLVSIGEMLSLSAERMPDKTALRARRASGFFEITYRELDMKTEVLASELHELGCRPSDRIAVIGENRPEWAIAYLAIHKGAFVAVPLDPALKEAEIKHILNDAEVKTVIAAGSFADMLSEIKRDLPHLKFIISMENLDAVLKTKKPVAKHLAANPALDDLAVLIYTSGTTGSSKGVMLSHRNIISNVDSVYRFIDFDHRDNFLSILPLHHTFETTCGFLLPLYNNATITYSPSLKSKDIIATMRETGVTALLGVPLLFEKFHEGVRRNVKNSPVFKKVFFNIFYRISSAFRPASGPLFRSVREQLGMGKMRYVISGGAALPLRVSSFFETLGVPILQGYGLTESAPVLTVNPPERFRNQSVGKPVPDVKIAINEPDEQGIGEIIASGPNIMLGYYRNELATNAVLRDGWLFTGDLGWIDKEGYLHIAGRKKSVIVTAGGKNVYPEEVETVLLASPFIKETVVLPRVDPETKKEEVYAIVHPDYEKIDELARQERRVFEEPDVEKLVREEIHKQCDGIAEYKRVKSFRIREEEFPKTTTKKIKRYIFEKEIVKV